jgi:hypothetical protein
VVLHIHGCVPFLPPATQRRPYSIALPMQPPHDSHQPRESCDVANEGGRGGSSDTKRSSCPSRSAAEARAAQQCCLAVDVKVIRRSSPLNVLKDTYDHSGYWARLSQYWAVHRPRESRG